MPRGAMAKRWIADDWGEVAAILSLLIVGILFAFFMKAVVVLVVAIGGGAALTLECAIGRWSGARESEVHQSGVQHAGDHVFLSYGMVEEQRRILMRIAAPVSQERGADAGDNPDGQARLTACDSPPLD